MVLHVSPAAWHAYDMQNMENRGHSSIENFPEPWVNTDFKDLTNVGHDIGIRKSREMGMAA